jgi:hypothetical protein
MLGFDVNPETGKGEGEGKLFYMSCGNRRHSRCVSCSETYGRDAWQVINSGLADPHQAAMFITLTAPGMGYLLKAPYKVKKKTDAWPYVMAEHHIQGSCHCKHFHAAGDSRIGAPLRVSAFDYRRAVSWNNHSSELYADFMRRWRKLAKGTPAYLRCAEHSSRGLIHYHLVVRGYWNRQHILKALTEARAYAGVKADENGRMKSYEYCHKFGDNYEITLMPKGDVNSRRRVSNYLSKYLTKGISTEPQGKGKLADHYERLRVESLRMVREQRPPCRWQRYNYEQRCTCKPCVQARRYSRRAWERFGATGHVLTKSSAHGRKWGKTMGECRQQRADFQKKTDKKTALALEWAFVDSGYGNSAEDALQERRAKLYRELTQRPPPSPEAASVAA